MSRFALLVLLSIIFKVYAAPPPPWIEGRKPRQDVKLVELYEACSVIGETSRGKIPYFDCESYVYGILDAYLTLRDIIPITKRACFPSTLPPWRALEIAEPSRFTERNAAQPAGQVIIDALQKEFPCKSIK